MKVTVAIELFRKGRLSSGLAARWVGQERMPFLMKAMEQGAYLPLLAFSALCRFDLLEEKIRQLQGIGFRYHEPLVMRVAGLVGEY